MAAAAAVIIVRRAHNSRRVPVLLTRENNNNKHDRESKTGAPELLGTFGKRHDWLAPKARLSAGSLRCSCHYWHPLWRGSFHPVCERAPRRGREERVKLSRARDFGLLNWGSKQRNWKYPKPAAAASACAVGAIDGAPPLLLYENRVPNSRTRHQQPACFPELVLPLCYLPKFYIIFFVENAISRLENFHENFILSFHFIFIFINFLKYRLFWNSIGYSRGAVWAGSPEWIWNGTNEGGQGTQRESRIRKARADAGFWG